MAIDKSLPNKKVEIPGQQEQIEEQIEIREELPDAGDTGSFAFASLRSCRPVATMLASLSLSHVQRYRSPSEYPH